MILGRMIEVAREYRPDASAILYRGDCVDFLNQVPDESAQLIVTSPPYNIGKAYEKRAGLDAYLAGQRHVIELCYRKLSQSGSICWQVGNYVDNGSIQPLDVLLYPIFSDLGMKMRNRIIWRFEHGLHASNRFSGRYETIMWFTKSEDYVFDLDPVRVPQKYPGKKHFKGPKAGQYSGNPLGKNPGDVWDIPNVKSNHVEKTEHPCQFPVELIERLVLSMTRPGDLVIDPYAGVGTTIVAAVLRNRRGAGAELVEQYCHIAEERILSAAGGTLQVRPMNKPVFDPKNAGIALTRSPWIATIDHVATARLMDAGE